MKKTLFILIVLILSLLYYMGFLTKHETFPFSKEFFSVETSPSADQVIDLKGRWSSKAKSEPGGAPAAAPKDFTSLYQLKLDQGIRNLPLVSLYAIRQAKESREAGRPDQAVEWATLSVKFSPELPDPYFELAWALWSKNLFQVHGPFLELWKGLKASLQYFPTSLKFFYNAFYILANALLMTFIVFGIVILVKYLPLYFYDIRKNLSQEVSKLLLNSLKIFLLFIPFFLRLDILWALLFYLILLWGFITKRERQFVLFFFIALVYLPFFLRFSSSFLDGASSDILFEINKANYEDWNRTTEQRLKQWLVTHPDDSDVTFTLGLMEKRLGRYAQAEDYYRKAIQVSPGLDAAISNLGNIYFSRKQTDLAISSYQQAVDLNPQQGAYYFNLYRAYTQETFLSGKKDRAFQIARSLDPQLVEYYTSIDTPPHPNRLVVDGVLSAQMLWNRFLTQFIGREGLLFRMFKAWFEKVPSRIPFLAPLLFLGFMIGMSKFARTRRFLTRCPMCGSPTHRFYLGNTDQEYICFNCYRIYIQKEKLHPKITQKKGLQIQSYQRENFFLGKTLSFLFTGFRDLWEDHGLKGLLSLFVFFIFVLRFVYWNGVLVSPMARPVFSPWELIVWVGLFACFYVLRVRRLFRLRPKAEWKK